jgi:hypothetical protein
MQPLGTDIETVKQQIEQLKAFKAEVDPHMIKVETLNRYEKLSFHMILIYEDTNLICCLK